MAQIFRKEPAVTTAQERPKARPAAGGEGGGTRLRFVSRLARNFDEIASELRKVTWPTREETRNLTIVVIGISAVIGIFLGSLDLLLSQLYRLINP